MDFTPSRSIDSGCVDSGSVRRLLQFSNCESTPCSTKVNTRKRKSLKYEIPSTITSGRQLSNIIENQEHELAHTHVHANGIDQSLNDSCFSDTSFFDSTSKNNVSFHEISFNKGVVQRSSPIYSSCDDIKLSSSLEKCTLDDFDLNYESHINAKKCKWDNEDIECSKKSNSAPGTPQRSTETDPESYLKKYHSLEFTPTKIGTPERNEILYPSLIEVKPASKPKSPLKLRNELKRVTKPARKRLFPCKDFVHLFTNVRKLGFVIHNIFSYLNDSDLVNVAKVSPLWKKALENDRDLYKRYRLHMKNINISKENIFSNSIFKKDTSTGSFSVINKSNFQSPEARSPPISPARENWSKFTRVAAQIKSTQRLTKCLICSLPAVIEKSIAQCTKENCAYLWCTKCMSGSKTGPIDFNCLCPGSRSPQSPLTDRSGLSDISNMDNSASYYFTEDNMYNSCSNRSSGYISLCDVEKTPSLYENSERKNSKIKNTVLTDCNKNLTSEKKHYSLNNTSNLQHSAALQRAKQNLSRRKDITEPSSPQKIRVHALGSKESKRKLRRLCL